MFSIAEAQHIIFSTAKNWGVETVSINEALGRVLAEDLISDRDYPPFNRAAMDGYAFLSIDFIEKGIREYKIVEEIYAGYPSKNTLKSGECYKIMTGAATPIAANTIIRVEDTIQKENQVEFLVSEIQSGKNIAKQGEDKRKGELVLPRNIALNPIHIASIAVIGISQLQVYKLPSVVIISTGDEIKGINEKVDFFQIRESNSYTVESFLKRYNIPVRKKIIVPDNKEKLTQAISAALQTDILILSGGVSMGDADYVPEVLQALGVKKLFHKVAIKPGKPLWFGQNQYGVVFALPGNPFSVQVAFKIFIEPFLRKSFNLSSLTNIMKLPFGAIRKKKGSLDEYIPCCIDSTSQSKVVPTSINGSGDVTSIVNSQGIALHEKDRPELKEGDIVSFLYW